MKITVSMIHAIVAKRRFITVATRAGIIANPAFAPVSSGASANLPLNSSKVATVLL